MAKTRGLGPAALSNGPRVSFTKLLAGPEETLLGRRDGSYIFLLLQNEEIRMFRCEAVNLDFLETAPVRFDVAVHVGRPPSEVFAALAHNPAAWGEFYPGFDRTGRCDTPAPPWRWLPPRSPVLGRKVRGASWPGMKAHDGHSALTAHMRRCSTPALRTTTSMPTVATPPCCAGRSPTSRDSRSNLLDLYLPRFLTFALTRAGHNLEHGRWFSTPTTDL